MLARGPRDAFDLNAAGGAIHPAQRVEEEHRQPPKRHKLKMPPTEPVVSRPGLATFRTDRSAPLAEANLNVKDHARLRITPANRAVHKTGVQLHPIQNRLKLHPVSPLADNWISWSEPILPDKETGCSIFVNSVVVLPLSTGSATHRFC